MSATSSLRKIAASRANGRLGKGPKTDQGKRTSSLNALDHGFSAQFAFLPSEDPLEYQAHHDAYREYYRSTDDANRAVVAEIADLNWRLRRAPAFEAAVLAEEIRTLALTPRPATTFASKAEIVDIALARLPKSRGLALLRRYTNPINRRIDELHSRLAGASRLPQFRPYSKQKLAA